eukprot:3605512-Amphidinium_carterae.1
MSTSKVALQTTLGTKDKPSALAADADQRQQRPLSEMTCKFFLSDDGCKKGRLCEARHVPKEKGCRKCGCLKQRSNECEYGKPVEKDKKDKKKTAPRPKAREAATSSAAAKAPPKKDKKKDGKKPRNKDKDGKK